MRRRLSDTKRGVSEDAARTTEKSGAGPESIDGLRRNASEGVPDKDRGNSLDGSTRSVRSSSGNERSSKVKSLNPLCGTSTRIPSGLVSSPPKDMTANINCTKPPIST